MKLKKGFVLREVCGEYVIVGEGLGAVDFGRLLCLNETAAWLWREALSMGDFTIEQLADRLCDSYDVTLDEARQDVVAIVTEWQSNGIVFDR